ncbi:MAG: hypothetical protein KY443_04620, partial [Actinobacteria bacterium]|nr:hypothetical protein [Actinomycetota bacterium]
PLTGWRLFSTVRGPTLPGWEAVVVADDGSEAAVPFDRTGRGFRGALHVLQDFPRTPQAQRQAVCRTWASAARQVGVDVRAVRIYRTVSTVSLKTSPPTTVKVRRLHTACSP